MVSASMMSLIVSTSWIPSCGTLRRNRLLTYTEKAKGKV